MKTEGWTSWPGSHIMTVMTQFEFDHFDQVPQPGPRWWQGLQWFGVPVVTSGDQWWPAQSRSSIGSRCKAWRRGGDGTNDVQEVAWLRLSMFLMFCVMLNYQNLWSHCSLFKKLRVGGRNQETKRSGVLTSRNGFKFGNYFCSLTWPSLEMSHNLWSTDHSAGFQRCCKEGQEIDEKMEDCKVWQLQIGHRSLYLQQIFYTYCKWCS